MDYSRRAFHRLRRSITGIYLSTFTTTTTAGDLIRWLLTTSEFTRKFFSHIFMMKPRRGIRWMSRQYSIPRPMQSYESSRVCLPIIFISTMLCSVLKQCLSAALEKLFGVQRGKNGINLPSCLQNRWERRRQRVWCRKVFSFNLQRGLYRLLSHRWRTNSHHCWRRGQPWSRLPEMTKRTKM